MKTKTVYVCSDCGAESPKWIGKCPSCGAWNTYVEEIVSKEPPAKRPLFDAPEKGKVRPVLLRDITATEETRIDLRDGELNHREVYIGVADGTASLGCPYALRVG